MNFLLGNYANISLLLNHKYVNVVLPSSLIIRNLQEKTAWHLLKLGVWEPVSLYKSPATYRPPDCQRESVQLVRRPCSTDWHLCWRNAPLSDSDQLLEAAGSSGLCPRQPDGLLPGSAVRPRGGPGTARNPTQLTYDLLMKFVFIEAGHPEDLCFLGECLFGSGTSACAHFPPV